jgi:ring-1,2-phenylacetyl-CoA epoxidase subunit PaaE
MNASVHFHELTVSRIRSEAGHSVVISLSVPLTLRTVFDFLPGQFVTLKAIIHGQDVRRSYSICSTPQHFHSTGEIDIGVRVVEGGVFSNWASSELTQGQLLLVMPPDGRFVSKRPNALHRVGFAAGSGITPILSIMRHTLGTQPNCQFSLVYGNQNMNSVMFNETLQDLKDQFPERVTLVHVLSRQAQEVELLEGRIDEAKVNRLINTLLPVNSMDEVFVCGPEGMIETTCKALLNAGVSADRIHSERFSTSQGLPARSVKSASSPQSSSGEVELTLVMDGKQHALRMSADEHILDVALAAGLDLPYSCRGGVCCTCRAKVMDGSVSMDKNFTLEKWETDKGFVLSCQSRPTSLRVTLSYDER